MELYKKQIKLLYGFAERVVQLLYNSHLQDGHVRVETCLSPRPSFPQIQLKYLCFQENG